MSPIKAEAGSFRDPSGRIYIKDDQVFRTIMPVAADDYEAVRATGLIEELGDRGWLIGATEVAIDALESVATDASYVVEHPKIPFISYPYEWPFPALKAAALHHLDVHLAAMEKGVTLSDASAYNIQFIGTQPIFIDLLSLRPYQDGEIWGGHRQFCEQFLNPLLLRAKLGLVHNHWYRGTQEGIPAADLRRMLPLRKKLSRNVLLHVVAQSALQNSSATQAKNSEQTIKTGRLPKASMVRMLEGLRRWISTMEPADTGKTIWQDYANAHSYSDEEVRTKQNLIAEFVRTTSPQTVWDLGCNSGDYSQVAIDAGAKRSIGFDVDQGALEAAFARGQADGLDILPLFFDAANPTPNQGWNQAERQGMSERANADGIMALAFIHHLAIARNIPLDDLVGWLMGLAPTGVIEFVPKEDPMVKQLLRLREDIFPDYTLDAFRHHITKRGRIVQDTQVSAAGRRLIQFERKPT